MDHLSDAYLSDIWLMLDAKMRESYKYTEESYELWFGRMQLSYLDADRAVFVCENETKRSIISKRFIEFIAASMADVLGYSPAITIEVDKSLAPVIPNSEGIISPVEIAKERKAAREQASLEAKAALEAKEALETNTAAADNEVSDNGWSQPQAPNLTPQVTAQDESNEVLEDPYEEFGTAPADPKNESRSERRLTYNEDFTFENFIVGNSNRFAHAAALNVADNIGTRINPLFIWGPSGLGKTHLMYAIANRALKRNQKMKVIYVKGEEFTNQLVEAIQKSRNQAFRQKYRSADMLLIDDIQFIAGKEATQTEFFHTFDALYEDKKQIILTSDRPPKELTGLEERIRSRFEAGLLADIQPPDYELRLAILRNKIGQNHIDVPKDVVDFLAQNLQENIRQLEGVIKKLAMSNLLTGQPVNMEMVIQTVPEYLRDAEPVSDTIDRIISCVARHYSVSVEDILGASRKKEIKTARNVAMYVIRSVTGQSLPQIGTVFSRDHSTVYSNINMIEAELVSDPVLEATIGEITKEIKRG